MWFEAPHSLELYMWRVLVREPQDEPSNITHIIANTGWKLARDKNGPNSSWNSRSSERALVAYAYNLYMFLLLAITYYGPKAKY